MSSVFLFVPKSYKTWIFFIRIVFVHGSKRIHAQGIQNLVQQFRFWKVIEKKERKLLGVKGFFKAFKGTWFCKIVSLFWRCFRLLWLPLLTGRLAIQTATGLRNKNTQENTCAKNNTFFDRKSLLKVFVTVIAIHRLAKVSKIKRTYLLQTLKMKCFFPCSYCPNNFLRDFHQLSDLVSLPSRPSSRRHEKKKLLFPFDFFCIPNKRWGKEREQENRSVMTLPPLFACKPASPGCLGGGGPRARTGAASNLLCFLAPERRQRRRQTTTRLVQPSIHPPLLIEIKRTSFSWKYIRGREKNGRRPKKRKWEETFLRNLFLVRQGKGHFIKFQRTELKRTNFMGACFLRAK